MGKNADLVVMGSAVLPREETAERKREPVNAFRSGLALSILWLINLLVIFFGWPFLLYGKLKYRKEQPESRSFN